MIVHFFFLLVMLRIAQILPQKYKLTCHRSSNKKKKKKIKHLLTRLLKFIDQKKGEERQGRKICLRREIEIEREKLRVTPREWESFLLYHLNRNCNTYGQRNQLLVFHIVECLSLIVYFYIICMNNCSSNPCRTPREPVFVTPHNLTQSKP